MSVELASNACQSNAKSYKNKSKLLMGAAAAARCWLGVHWLCLSFSE